MSSHPEDQRSAGMTVAITTTIIPTIAVAIHLYVRAKIMRKVVVADYLLYAAWLVYVGGFMPISFIVINLPMGVHRWNMSSEEIIRLIYWYHWTVVISNPVFVLLKVAIILQVLSVFAVPRGWTHWTGHVLIWVNAVLYAVIFLLHIFGCSPIAKSWDLTIKHGHCIDRTPTAVVSGTFNTVSDILIFALPQWVIWNLQMPRRRKVRVAAMFVIGLFACMSSTIRLYYSIVFLTNPHDFSRTLASVAFWCWPEMASGFLVAALPLCPRFFKDRGVRRVLHLPEITQTQTADKTSRMRTRKRNHDLDSGLSTGPYLTLASGIGDGSLASIEDHPETPPSRVHLAG